MFPISAISWTELTVDVVYWMLNFVGMAALGLACENVAMVVGQPWTGLWLIFVSSNRSHFACEVLLTSNVVGHHQRFDFILRHRPGTRSLLLRIRLPAPLCRWSKSTVALWATFSHRSRLRRSLRLGGSQFMHLPLYLLVHDVQEKAPSSWILGLENWMSSLSCISQRMYEGGQKGDT